MIQTNYNPDVLSCLANLSNDEVITPPSLANQILDILPEDLWRNKDAKFLDPVCKSGIFLREIAKRLMKGLDKEIPDKQTRINHIYKNQLFGIAITELTSLLSRRSIYCSKTSNGKYSVCEAFDNEEGNIMFGRIKHTWAHGNCKFCGASKEVYNRSDLLETHAYQFIHTVSPEKIFNMKFDVIVGNPPYQLNDGGGKGSSAMPIYHKFIQQAKKLNPRYLTMIIPSRWFTGGRGLDEFRIEMLNDNRIREIHDFLDASDCFPGVEIKGGVCYFLWNRDSSGECTIHTYNSGQETSTSVRPLLEKDVDVFVRYNEAISILRKVKAHKEVSITSIISANDPFGFDVREKNSYRRIKPNVNKKAIENGVKFYYYGWKSDGIGYVRKEKVQKNIEWIQKYKVLIPKAWGEGDMKTDWINPIIVEPNSCCSETYLVVGPTSDEKEAKNIVSYTQTKFFHFLVSLTKNTQNAMKKVYQFVPMQNFDESWDDDKLYEKYGLSSDEIMFIESTVNPLEEVI